MAFEGLRQNISELDENVSSYVEHSIEYAKLKSFKISMVLVTYMAKVVLVGTIVVLALLFLSTAASFALGNEMGNTTYGFAIIGLIYLVLGIIGYRFRDKLNKPLLKMFSEYFFEGP